MCKFSLFVVSFVKNSWFQMLETAVLTLEPRASPLETVKILWNPALVTRHVPIIWTSRATRTQKTLMIWQQRTPWCHRKSQSGSELEVGRGRPFHGLRLRANRIKVPHRTLATISRRENGADHRPPPGPKVDRINCRRLCTTIIDNLKSGTGPTCAVHRRMYKYSGLQGWGI